jgi:hypothetical protein
MEVVSSDSEYQPDPAEAEEDAHDIPNGRVNGGGGGGGGASNANGVNGTVVSSSSATNTPATPPPSSTPLSAADFQRLGVMLSRSSGEMSKTFAKRNFDIFRNDELKKIIRYLKEKFIAEYRVAPLFLTLSGKKADLVQNIIKSLTWTPKTSDVPRNQPPTSIAPPHQRPGAVTSHPPHQQPPQQHPPHHFPHPQVGYPHMAQRFGAEMGHFYPPHMVGLPGMQNAAAAYLMHQMTPVVPTPELLFQRPPPYPTPHEIALKNMIRIDAASLRSDEMKMARGPFVNCEDIIDQATITETVPAVLRFGFPPESLNQLKRDPSMQRFNGMIFPPPTPDANLTVVLRLFSTELKTWIPWDNAHHVFVNNMVIPTPAVSFLCG